MARIRAKLSMDELCNLMNNTVTKQSISKYEHGRMMPSDGVMIALSEALSVNPSYFIRPFSSQINKLSLSFRKKSAISKKDVNALKIEVQDKVERYLEVEQILGLPHVAPSFTAIGGPISHAEEMTERAKLLRAEWGLHEGPVDNVQSMLESHGIKVVLIDGPAGFDGVSGIVNGKLYIIALNRNSTHTERRRFTALHELGHLLFNSQFDADLKPNEKEKLCHAFANEMLLPTSSLRHMAVEDSIAWADLVKLQKKYGMSIDAIVHKLSDVGIMTCEQYRSFNIRKRMSDKLTRDVEQSRFTEPDTERFEDLVHTAWEKNLITISKAAELLDWSVTGVKRYWRTRYDKDSHC